MVKISRLRAQFVDLMPHKLEGGVLYISNRYKTAAHLCCCGCGCKVVTPLKRGGWQLTGRPTSVTLYPSIGNWGLPCRSHYWIVDGDVKWAEEWSPAQIEAGRIRDHNLRRKHFDRKPFLAGLIETIVKWFRGNV